MADHPSAETGLIIWDDIALDLFFRDPIAPVARDLLRRGLQIESAAKTNASGRPGPNVITGRLRSSINTKLGEDELSVFVDVGTSVYYAPYVEFGHPNTQHAYGRPDGTVGFVTNKPTKAYKFLRPAIAAGLH